jgi:hypothetical protein
MFNPFAPPKFRSLSTVAGATVTPISINFTSLPNGALPSPLTGATWAVSSGSAVNAPTTGNEMFTNPGAEGTYSSGLAPNWQATFNTGARSEETTIVHSGSSAQRLSATSGQREYILPANATTVAGTYYIGSLWAYVVSGTVPTLKLRASSGALNGFQVGAAQVTTASGWNKYTILGKATLTGLSIGCDIGSATGAGEVILDDASLKASSWPAVFATANLRTANMTVLAGMTFPADAHFGLSGIIVGGDAAAPQNFILAYYDGISLRLSKVVAGVETALINVVRTITAGEQIEVRRTGTSVSLYYAGAQISTTQTVSEAAILNGTYCGLIDTCGTQFASFAARPYGTLPAVTSFGQWATATYPSGNGVVSLRFDDWTTYDISDTLPLLTARGLLAGFAVPRARLGASGNATLAQALSTQATGHEIMCHSMSHSDNDPTSFADFQNETAVAVEEMRLLNLRADTFIQPGTWSGAYNMNSAAWYGTQGDLLLRQYFNSYEAYIVAWDSDSNKRNLPVPAANRYGAQVCSGTNSVATLEAIIDACISNHQGTTIGWHSHLIGTGAPQPTWAEFTEVLDYIVTKVAGGHLTVLTPTQQLFATAA